MRLSLALALAAGLLGETGCYIEDFGSARASRDFHYSYPLASGGRLSVESFNGGVDITPWEQNTVDISGTKYAPTEDEADAMRIDIDHAPDSISIRAVRPYDRRGNRGARFAIKVPRGAVLDRITTSNGAIHAEDAAGPSVFKTSNGAVRIEGMKGRLDIHTSNGPVELNRIDGDVTAHSSNGHIQVTGLRGSLEADTSNSRITANVESADRLVHAQTSNGGIELTLPPNFTAGVRAHTSNGGISLHLAEPINAEVDASTSNSDISTDIDTQVHGQIAKRHIQGTIGKGGPLFDLSTSNGPIRLMRSEHQL